MCFRAPVEDLHVTVLLTDIASSPFVIDGTTPLSFRVGYVEFLVTMNGLVEDQFRMPDFPGKHHFILYFVASDRTFEVRRHYRIFGGLEFIR
jgi:hypothetical protein